MASQFHNLAVKLTACCSTALRTLTGFTCTLSDGATALDDAELAWAGGCGGIPKDRYSRQALRDLLEQLQPFPARAVFERYETGGFAAPAAPGCRRSRRQPDRRRSGTQPVRCGSPAATAPRPWRHGSGQRVSMRTLWPMVQPNCCSACTIAAMRTLLYGSFAAEPESTPMRCTRAAC